MIKSKRRVLLQGAFDILHYGHIRAFEFAKAQGGYLIVALNTNRLIKEYKGRDAVLPWKDKKAIIESIRYVDQVVPIGLFSPLVLLKKYNIDVFVISPEWEYSKAEEIAYMKKKGGMVCFTQRYTGTSTTNIKQKLLQEYLDDARSKNVQAVPNSGGSLPSSHQAGNGSVQIP
jgi:glycerol-3-phosphate cytidylyltransferase